MNINNKFKLGDIVYIVIDKDQDKNIVDAIRIEGNGQIMYRCGDTYYYDYLLSETVDMHLKLNISNDTE